MSDQPTPQPERDWRGMRRDERHHRREMRWGQNGPWIGGVILIALGVIFLLQNFGFPLPQNWWAVFILIPAAGAFSGALQAYRRNGGRMSAGVTAPAIGGVILTLLAVALFFNFDFGKYWPVILILLGIAALSGGFWRRGEGPPAA